MTDVGVIPEDWEVKSIGEICCDTKYGVAAEAIPFDGINKYIRITDIDDEDGHFVQGNLTSPSFFMPIHILGENDLLIARTGASVGKSYLYNKKDGKLIFAGFLMKFNINKANPKLVFYKTMTSEYHDYIESESMRSGQPGVNIQQIKDYTVSLPKAIKEQQAIADALTKVDNLIMSLSKVIEKKKLIKKGTMQKLLSGEVRLDGFEGEWNFISFKNIYTYASEGGTPDTKNEKYYKSGVIPFVKIEDTISKYIKCASTFITELGLEQSSAWILAAGNLILTNGATIGNVSINLIPITTKQGILGIIVNSDYHTEFLYYLFKNETFQTELQSKMAIGTFATITLNNLNDIQLLIPPTKVEQTAIAKVLTTMDNEIEALVKERDKYKCIKQGMMQQLLTGKIRLICQ